MRKYVVAVVMLIALMPSVHAQLTPQQQKMKDCNAQSRDLRGDAGQRARRAESGRPLHCSLASARVLAVR